MQQSPEELSRALKSLSTTPLPDGIGDTQVRANWARYVVAIVDVRRHVTNSQMPPQLRQIYVETGMRLLSHAKLLRQQIEERYK